MKRIVVQSVGIRGEPSSVAGVGIVAAGTGRCEDEGLRDRVRNMISDHNVP